MTEVLRPFFEFEKERSPFLISNPEHGAAYRLLLVFIFTVGQFNFISSQK
jgi:hypothetical protein